ncbi:MAG: hypothetical protein HQL18_03890 [Candidatus Omnitrophica bacterium]|nr:hypothetical protein [Candidatus Omnitrophota bacterium]
MTQTFADKIEQIYNRDPRYKPGAYEFVMEGIGFTQQKFKRERHVSGEELLQGLRELAIKKFGPLAQTVLGHWGVQATDDFGYIVFSLVENGLLAREEEDTIESFRNGFNFAEAFAQGYRRELSKEIGRIK